MEAFVYDLRTEHSLMAPILKARYDSVYTAIYQSDGAKLTLLKEPSFASASYFAEIMERYPDCTIVGADRNLYPSIMLLNNKYIERQSGGGGQVALLGEIKCQEALLPCEIKENTYENRISDHRNNNYLLLSEYKEFNLFLE